jgi:hypothetical protein
MTESVAYMSENGVLFKEMPPNPMFELTPLYKLRELTEWEIKECWEEATEMREHFCSQYFDFAQLILKKAREK